MIARLTLVFLSLAVVSSAQFYAPHRRVAFQPVAAGGTPTEVDQISGLFAWYKPDTLMTNLAGGTTLGQDTNIIAWGDSSGNGHHLTTNNPTASGPKLESTGLGFWGVEFGAGQYIRAAFTAQADTTTFIVWRIASSGSFIFVYDSTNSSSRQFLYKDNSERWTIGSPTDTTAGVAQINNWYINAIVYNSGGDDSVYTNSVAATTTASSGNASLDGLTLGANNAGNLSPGNNSYVGEKVIYNRVLNSTEIGQVFTILNTRWGIY